MNQRNFRFGLSTGRHQILELLIEFGRCKVDSLLLLLSLTYSGSWIEGVCQVVVCVAALFCILKRNPLSDLLSLVLLIVFYHQCVLIVALQVLQYVMIKCYSLLLLCLASTILI